MWPWAWVGMEGGQLEGAYNKNETLILKHVIIRYLFNSGTLLKTKLTQHFVEHMSLVCSKTLE